MLAFYYMSDYLKEKKKFNPMKTLEPTPNQIKERIERLELLRMEVKDYNQKQAIWDSIQHLRSRLKNFITPQPCVLLNS